MYISVMREDLKGLGKAVKYRTQLMVRAESLKKSECEGETTSSLPDTEKSACPHTLDM